MPTPKRSSRRSRARDRRVRRAHATPRSSTRHDRDRRGACAHLARAARRATARSPRARAMSRALIAKYGGDVPRDLERLKQLPGVGHKTASVVFAQAFDEPAFPVDTHVHRLAGRWQLSHARTVEQVERDLKQLFPRETW